MFWIIAAFIILVWAVTGGIFTGTGAGGFPPIGSVPKSGPSCRFKVNEWWHSLTLGQKMLAGAYYAWLLFRCIG